MIPTDEAVLICPPEYNDDCPDTERDEGPYSDRVSDVYDMGALVYSAELEEAFYTEHCCDDDDARSNDHNDANDEEF